MVDGKPKYVCKSEKDVKRHVKKLLDKHEWFWWMPSANGFGTLGVADICAIHRKSGSFMAIETKFNKNKPSPHQKAFLETVNACYAMAFVVDENRIETLEQYFDMFAESIVAFSKKEQLTHEKGAAMLEAVRILTELIV